MTPIDVGKICPRRGVYHYRVMKLLKDTSAARLAKRYSYSGAYHAVRQLPASDHDLVAAAQRAQRRHYSPLWSFSAGLRRLLEQIGKGNLSRMLIPDTDPDVVESMIVLQAVFYRPCADMSGPRPARSSCSSARRLNEIIATGTSGRGTVCRAHQRTFSSETARCMTRHDRPCRTGVRCRLRAAAFRQSGSVARPRHAPPRGCRRPGETADSVLVVISKGTGAICRHRRHAQRHLSPEILQKMLEAGCSAMNSGTKTRKAVLPPSATEVEECRQESEEEFLSKSRIFC